MGLKGGLDTDFFCGSSTGNVFQYGRADIENALEAVFYLNFGINKRCLDAERRIRVLTNGVNMVCRYEGSLNMRVLKVRRPSLNWIRYSTLVTSAVVWSCKI